MTDHEEGSIRARWVESRFECANSTRGKFVSATLEIFKSSVFSVSSSLASIDSWHPPLTRLPLRLHASRGRPPGSAQDPAIGRRR
jgi:hypothetical protein